MRFPRRSPPAVLTVQRAAWVCFALGALASVAGCGTSHRWTEKQAESIQEVRGYTLHDIDCRPQKRAFACDGVIGKGVRAVWVTYVLHPRGSGYYLSKVRFYAFGVP